MNAYLLEQGRGKPPQCHKNYVESITRQLQTSQFVLLTIHLQAAHIQRQSKLEIVVQRAYMCVRSQNVSNRTRCSSIDD